MLSTFNIAIMHSQLSRRSTARVLNTRFSLVGPSKFKSCPMKVELEDSFKTIQFWQVTRVTTLQTWVLPGPSSVSSGSPFRPWYKWPSLHFYCTIILVKRPSAEEWHGCHSKNKCNDFLNKWTQVVIEMVKSESQLSFHAFHEGILEHSRIYYGISYLLAWTVFIIHIIAGVAFLLFSKKRKYLKHDFNTTLKWTKTTDFSKEEKWSRVH